jgi:hypothetical protein
MPLSLDSGERVDAKPVAGLLQTALPHGRFLMDKYNNATVLRFTASQVPELTGL